MAMGGRTDEERAALKRAERLIVVAACAWVRERRVLVLRDCRQERRDELMEAVQVWEELRWRRS